MNISKSKKSISWIKCFFVCSQLLSVSSCSFFNTKASKSISFQAPAKGPKQDEMQALQDSLWVRLKEAEELQSKGQTEEAIKAYNAVVVMSVRDFSRITALALMRVAESYEKVDSLDIAEASLFDAGKRADFLNAEERDIELPFRWASHMIRRGREDLARSYLLQVSRNITPYLDPTRKQSPWVGPAILAMARIGVPPRSYESFRTSTLQFASVQKYLIRCMELKENKEFSHWSDQCHQQGELSWRGFLEFAHQYTIPSSMDYYISARVENERKIDMFVDLRVLVNSVNRFRPLSVSESPALVQKYYATVDEVDKAITLRLASFPESTALSQESKQLNALKRAMRILPEFTAPSSHRRLQKSEPEEVHNVQ